ncbi:MAG: hypothetical protein AAGA23_20380 [Pseudomonadota bacterium]
MKAAALALSLLCLPAAAEPEQDDFTGLQIAPGWELVRAHCGACHSYRLITAQRGDEAFWRKTIRWMQQTQNLWPIPEAQETAIIDYLAKNYAEESWGRRPPLPASLRPAPVTSTDIAPAPREPAR